MSEPGSVAERDFAKVIGKIIDGANIKLAKKRETLKESIRGEFVRCGEKMTISLSENGRYVEDSFAKVHINNRDAIPIIKEYLDIFLREFNERSSGKKFTGVVSVEGDSRPGCYEDYYRFKFTPIDP
jgi:hypothetical protein